MLTARRTRRARRPSARARTLRGAWRGAAGAARSAATAIGRVTAERPRRAAPCHQLAPGRSFTTWLSFCPARTRTRSVANASPASTATSTSLLDLVVGEERDVRSPRRGAPRRCRALAGSDRAPCMRAVRLGGSVVTTRRAGRHFSLRAMIFSGGSGLVGADLDPLDEAAAAGAAQLEQVGGVPGDSRCGVAGVVGELALAVQVDVDVLGRRSQRERPARRAAGRPARPVRATCRSARARPACA